MYTDPVPLIKFWDPLDYNLPTYYRLQSILSIQGVITYVMILLLYTAMLYNKALKNKVSLRNC